ncbi:hypothetical protein GCM10009850_027950 [Nonomuraea monospora]|uniref:Peptidase inhibitor family I36 n=1 Tax=Nonomuraea monospora TaxID=568818 RepID=A0ABN3CE35_9ACTN
MRKLRAALLAVVPAAAIFVGAPTALAQTGPADEPSVGGTSNAPVPAAPGARLAAPDGRVYIYDLRNFTGSWCGTPTNEQDYRNIGGTCPNMDNRTTSMWNNGYVETFDDVRFYRDYVYAGPNMCLGLGDSWGDLALGWELFNTGENANNKISSHIWASSCP